MKNETRRCEHQGKKAHHALPLPAPCPPRAGPSSPLKRTGQTMQISFMLHPPSLFKKLAKESRCLQLPACTQQCAHPGALRQSVAQTAPMSLQLHGQPLPAPYPAQCFVVDASQTLTCDEGGSAPYKHIGPRGGATHVQPLITDTLPYSLQSVVLGFLLALCHPQLELHALPAAATWRSVMQGTQVM